MDLNHDGVYLLERARELLTLNDEIMRSMQASPVHGTIRLGIAVELSTRFLPRILDRFTHAAPGVEVEVEAAASCILATKLKNAELDLAIIRNGLQPRHWAGVEVWRSQVNWITSETHGQHLRDPMPLATSLADCPWRPADLAECPWRSMMTSALEEAGRAYRIVSTSGTTLAQMAAVQAGLAITSALADEQLLEGLRILRADEGLPALPESRYLMMKARDPRQPITDLLALQVQDVFDPDREAVTV